MKKKVLLFLLKKSVYFATNIDDFKKIIITLSKMPSFEVEVVDVTEHPELAEKYRIEALPTLIIDNKRYVGTPTVQKVLDIFNKEM